MAAAPCRAILPLKLVEEGPAASIQNNSPPSHMIRREFITLLGGARAAAELVGAERGSGAIVVEFSPGRVAR
jgi:hypothetical protein